MGVIRTMFTKSQNITLMAPVIECEVFKPLKGLGGDKAPGSDGFLAMFFQKLGFIFQKELWEVVEESRQGSFILKDFNNTFRVLVPKKATQLTFEDFKPISLCNIVYKIISKAWLTDLNRF